MSASSPQFLRAHQEAQKAVATFLPSLGPNPPAPPPPPPHPLQKRNVVDEMTHAASMARHVEQASSNIALGKPANPNPPTPQQQFGNVLDVIHTRAIQSAIAAHPEDQRSRLISEAHDSATQWIASHNGKVIVHGKVMVAKSPEQAETLAAKIVNDTVEEHDQRKRDEAEALANPEGSGGNDAQPKADGGRSGDKGGRAVLPAADSPVPRTPPLASVRPSEAPDDVRPQAPIGSTDADSGRVITHSTDDLDEAQDIATQAAPELEDKLQDVADSIPGVEVHGVRDTKDKDRAQRKTEADDKPVNTHSDLLAGRLTVDSTEAKDAAVAALKSTSPVIDEEDKFQDGDPDYGFRSHDLQVALANGSTSAEVQVVPKEVADLDDETHKTYEKGRDAEADGDNETADAAKAENKEKHDAAMNKFNERNGVADSGAKNDENNSDRAAKLRQILAEAGFDVTGDPVRIGGHAFLPIKETQDAPQ